MHRFEYLSPATLSEAVSMLDRCGASARVIAGGTDLITAFKEGWDRPAWVINLADLGELDFIKYDLIDGLWIGAGTTVRDVEISALVRAHYPVVSAAAATLASIQIRNLATVAGNICRASPSADMPPALLVLDASIVLIGPDGERSVPLSELFIGPGKTVIAANEILKEIHLPPEQVHSGEVYIKHCPRQAMDLASIGIAAGLTLAAGKISKARIALGAVAPTPRRSLKAEDVLIGQVPSPDLFGKAAEYAAADAQPIGDIRASASYRHKMVGVLVHRALDQALELAERNNS